MDETLLWFKLEFLRLLVNMHMKDICVKATKEKKNPED